MKLLFLVSLCVLQLTGCANVSQFSHFAGVYSCNEYLIIDEMEFEKFVDQIEVAIKPFGFQRVPVSNAIPYVLFAIGDAHNRINLVIKKEAFGVSITDYKHFDETDIVQAVKEAVKPHLLKRCEGTLKFERVSDFLS